MLLCCHLRSAALPYLLLCECGSFLLLGVVKTQENFSEKSSVLAGFYFRPITAAFFCPHIQPEQIWASWSYKHPQSSDQLSHKCLSASINHLYHLEKKNSRIKMRSERDNAREEGSVGFIYCFCFRSQGGCMMSSTTVSEASTTVTSSTVDSTSKVSTY